MRRCRPPITATPTIALDSRRRPGCLLTEFRGRPTRNGCPRRRPPPATLIEQGSVKVRIGLEATGCSNVARKTAARRCKRQRQLVWRSARVKQVYMRWLCGDGQLTVGDHCALHQPFQTLHLCHLLFFFSRIVVRLRRHSSPPPPLMYATLLSLRLAERVAFSLRRSQEGVNRGRPRFFSF